MLIDQTLHVFQPLHKDIDPFYLKDYIWVLIPLMVLLPRQCLILMEYSHRSLKNGEDKPYNPVVLPGQALMFHKDLRTSRPTVAGGLVFIRVYDMTGKLDSS